MKLKKYMAAGSLLALLALGGTGCSSEEIVGNGPETEIPDTGKAELVFQFGGLKLKSPGTRAETIATEDETVVENLVIILAGVDDETHTTGNAAIVYEYRSVWNNPPVETDHYKQLTLTQTGNVLTGKLLVDEAVMLPAYVSKKALVLVNGIKMNLTDTDGTVSVLTNAEAISKVRGSVLYQLCGGSVGGKDLAADGASMELVWGPDDLTAESIGCPLPMTSRIESINFHGSTNINVPLTRRVSRFDLRNGQSAQLRIGSIRPMDATTGIEFDEATGTRVDMTDQSFLPAAPGADWANVPAEVVPAFYTFPSALVANEQPMKFRVSAKRLDGATGLWEDKTYTLLLENAEKKPVSIDKNTRYVINISEVTDLHITGAIVIADWEQGGDVDGDLNPATASRKTPTMNGVAGDDANQIAWTLAADGVTPTALFFGKALNGQSISFSTPKVMPIDASAPDTDQPRVAIDIFKEAGVGGPGTVWLTVSETTLTRAAGDIEHKLTVVAPADGNYVPLYVKVKNHFYPEQFVMFRVTAVASDKIIVDPENGASVPDGWKQDPDNDVFEEGVIETTYYYEGEESILVALPGHTAYYVAPKDAVSDVQWIDVNFDTACPAGWKVPSKNDVEAMFGSNPNDLDIGYILGTHHSWHTSTESDADNAYYWGVGSSGQVTFGTDPKTGYFAPSDIRCVRVKK